MDKPEVPRLTSTTHVWAVGSTQVTLIQGATREEVQIRVDIQHPDGHNWLKALEIHRVTQEQLEDVIAAFTSAREFLVRGKE